MRCPSTPINDRLSLSSLHFANIPFFEFQLRMTVSLSGSDGYRNEDNFSLLNDIELHNSIHNFNIYLQNEALCRVF